MSCFSDWNSINKRLKLYFLCAYIYIYIYIYHIPRLLDYILVGCAGSIGFTACTDEPQWERNSCPRLPNYLDTARLVLNLFSVRLAWRITESANDKNVIEYNCLYKEVCYVTHPVIQTVMNIALRDCTEWGSLPGLGAPYCGGKVFWRTGMGLLTFPKSFPVERWGLATPSRKGETTASAASTSP